MAAAGPAVTGTEQEGAAAAEPGLGGRLEQYAVRLYRAMQELHDPQPDAAAAVAGGSGDQDKPLSRAQVGRKG